MSGFLRESIRDPDSPFVPRAFRASFELIVKLLRPGGHGTYGPAHLLTIVLCEFLYGAAGEPSGSFLYSDVQQSGEGFLNAALDGLLARVMPTARLKLSPLEQRLLEEYIRILHFSACSMFGVYQEPYPLHSAFERVLAGDDPAVLSSLPSADRALFSCLEELAGQPTQPTPLRIIAILLRKLFPKATCGRFVDGGIAYRCQTCSRDRSSIYCPDCFRPEQHEGHDYLTLLHVKGMCDCGCIQSISPEGFCPAHRGNTLTDVLASQLRTSSPDSVSGIPRVGLVLLPFLNWRAILASHFLIVLAYFHSAIFIPKLESHVGTFIHLRRVSEALTTLFLGLTKIPDLNFFDELLTKAIIYGPLCTCGSQGERRYVLSRASLNDILFGTADETKPGSPDAESAETAYSAYLSRFRSSELGFVPFYRDQLGCLKRVMAAGDAISVYCTVAKPGDFGRTDLLERNFEVGQMNNQNAGLDTIEFDHRSSSASSQDNPSTDDSFSLQQVSQKNSKKLLKSWRGGQLEARRRPLPLDNIFPLITAMFPDGGSDDSTTDNSNPLSGTALAPRDALMEMYCGQNLIFFVMLLPQLQEIFSDFPMATDAFTHYLFSDLLGEPMYRSYMTYAFSFEFPLTLASNLNSPEPYDRSLSLKSESTLRRYTADNVILCRRIGQQIHGYREFSMLSRILQGKPLDVTEAVQFRYESVKYYSAQPLHDIRYKRYTASFTDVPVQLCTHLVLERHRAIGLTTFMFFFASAILDTIAIDRPVFPTVVAKGAAFPARLPGMGVEGEKLDNSLSYCQFVREAYSRAPDSPLALWVASDAASLLRGVVELLAGLYPAEHDQRTGKFTYQPNSLPATLSPDGTVTIPPIALSSPAGALLSHIANIPLNQLQDPVESGASDAKVAPSSGVQSIPAIQGLLEATPFWAATQAPWGDLSRFLALLEFKSMDKLDALLTQQAIRRLPQNTDLITMKLCGNEWIVANSPTLQQLLEHFRNQLRELRALCCEGATLPPDLLQALDGTALNIVTISQTDFTALHKVASKVLQGQEVGDACRDIILSRIEHLGQDWQALVRTQAERALSATMIKRNLEGALTYYTTAGQIVYSSKTTDFYLTLASNRITSDCLASWFAVVDAVRVARIKVSNHREDDFSYNSILRLNLLAATFFSNDFFFGIPQSLALGVAQNVQSVQSPVYVNVRRTGDPLLPGEVEATIIRYCSPAAQASTAFSRNHSSSKTMCGPIAIPKDFSFEAFAYVLTKDLESITNLSLAFVRQVILAGYAHTALMVPLGARAGCWGPGAIKSTGVSGTTEISDPDDLLRIPDYFGMHCPYSVQTQDDPSIGSGMYEWPFHSLLSQILGLCMFTYERMHQERDSLREKVLAAQSHGELQTPPGALLARFPTLPQFIQMLVEEELLNGEALETVGLTLSRRGLQEAASQLPKCRPELYCLCNGVNPYSYLIEEPIRIIVARAIQLGGGFVRCGAELAFAASLVHTNTDNEFYTIAYNHALVQAMMLLALEREETERRISQANGSEPVRSVSHVPCTTTSILAQILSRFGLCKIETSSGEARAVYSRASLMPEDSSLSSHLLTEALIFLTSLYMYDYLSGDIYTTQREMILESLMEEESVPSDYFQHAYFEFASYNPVHLSQMLSEVAELDSSTSSRYCDIYDYDPEKWGDRYRISAAGWQRASFYSPLIRTCPDLLDKYQDFRQSLGKKGQLDLVDLPVIPQSVTCAAAHEGIQKEVLSSALYADLCLDFFESIILPAFSVSDGPRGAGVVQADILLGLGGVLCFVERSPWSIHNQNVLSRLKKLGSQILSTATASSAFANRSRFLPAVSQMIEKIIIQLGVTCSPGTLTGERALPDDKTMSAMKKRIHEILHKRMANTAQPEPAEGVASAQSHSEAGKHSLLLLCDSKQAENESACVGESLEGLTTESSGASPLETPSEILEEFFEAVRSGATKATASPLTLLPEEIRPVDTDSFTALLKLISSGPGKTCITCHDPGQAFALFQTATVAPTSYQYRHSGSEPDAQAAGSRDLLFHPWVKSLTHYLEGQRLNLDSSKLSKLYDPIFQRTSASVSCLLARIAFFFFKQGKTKFDWTKVLPSAPKRLLQSYTPPPPGIPPLDAQALRRMLLGSLESLPVCFPVETPAGITASERQQHDRTVLERRVGTLSYAYLHSTALLNELLQEHMAGASAIAGSVKGATGASDADDAHVGSEADSSVARDTSIVANENEVGDAEDNAKLVSLLQASTDAQSEPFLLTLGVPHDVLYGEYTLQLANFLFHSDFPSADEALDSLREAYLRGRAAPQKAIAVHPFDALKLSSIDGESYHAPELFLEAHEKHQVYSEASEQEAADLAAKLSEAFSRFGLEEELLPAPTNDFSSSFLEKYPLLRYDPKSDMMVAQPLYLSSYIAPGKDYLLEHFASLSGSSGKLGFLYDDGIQGVMLNPPVISDLSAALTPILTNEVGFHVKGCRHAIHMPCYVSQPRKPMLRFTDEFDVCECNLCRRQTTLALPIISPLPRTSETHMMMRSASALFHTLWSRAVMRGVFPSADSMFGLNHLLFFSDYHSCSSALEASLFIVSVVFRSIVILTAPEDQSRKATGYTDKLAGGTFGTYLLECLRLVLPPESDWRAVVSGAGLEKDLAPKLKDFLEAMPPSLTSIGGKSCSTRQRLAALGSVFISKMASQAKAAVALFTETALYNVFSVYRLVVTEASSERSSGESSEQAHRSLAHALAKPIEELCTTIDYSTSILQLAIYLLQLVRGDLDGNRTVSERAAQKMLVLDTAAEKNVLARTFYSTLRSDFPKTMKAGILHNVLQRYLLLLAVESLGDEDPGTTCFPAIERLSTSLNGEFCFLLQAAADSLIPDLLEIQLAMTYAAVAGTPTISARQNYTKYMFYLKRTPEGIKKAAEDQLITETTDSYTEFIKAASLELRQCFVSHFTETRLTGAEKQAGLRSCLSATKMFYAAVDRVWAVLGLGRLSRGEGERPASHLRTLIFGPSNVAADFCPLLPPLRPTPTLSLPLTSADAQILTTGHKQLTCASCMQKYTPASSWMAICMYCGELLCPLSGQWRSRVREANPQGPSHKALKNVLYLYGGPKGSEIEALEVLDGLELHAAQCCQQVCAYFPRFNYIIICDGNFYVHTAPGPYLSPMHVSDAGYQSGEALRLSPELLFVLRRALMFETTFEAPLMYEQFHPRYSLQQVYSNMERLGVDENFEDEWA